MATSRTAPTSTQRALAVLDCFSASTPALTLSEIADAGSAGVVHAQGDRSPS